MKKGKANLLEFYDSEGAPGGMKDTFYKSAFLILLSERQGYLFLISWLLKGLGERTEC